MTAGAAELVVQAELSENPPAFSSTNGDLTRRVRTAAQALWSPLDWTTVGETVRSPDLFPVIQEVVDQPGWRYGNALVLLVSGSGERTAESFEGSSSAAPLLHIEYAAEPPRCGDGICQIGETCDECSLDCGVCEPRCGDGACDPNENCLRCPEDCGSCQDTCGDAACGLSEDCSSCAEDCGSCDGRVRFAVIGDFGYDTAAEGEVASMIAGWDPDFIVTVGDNNYPSGEAATIDRNIGKYYAAFIGNYQGEYGPGSEVNRFWPSPGNHDWGLGTLQPYLDYFTLPGNERYYAVEQGPVHLFVLDSDPNEPDGTSASSVQAQWLEESLAASSSCWNLVVMHHAPYSSGRHGSTRELQWPYQSWGADGVLSGHDHLYERLEVRGMPYFVTGAGGRSLYAFRGAPIAESQARYNEDYGAMLVEAAPGQIRYRYYTHDGVLRDFHSVSKPCP